MAENQTAAEDSGQHSQQHQQAQQPQSPQHEQSPQAATSPSTSQENSASSPEDTQTVIIPSLNHILHHSHHTQMEEQLQPRGMVERQMNSKFKSSSMSTQRRNTIQTPARSTSTTSIKKPTLTKMTSLNVSGGGSGTGTSIANSNAESGKHHHHQHSHHHQNSITSNHHHSGNVENGSGNSNANAVQRRTSESLRLHTSLVGSSVGESSTANISSTTSNSSLHSNSNLTNSFSSSSSVAPQSTSTASTSKDTSPNNNGGSSSVSNRNHQSHGHHHTNQHHPAIQSSRKPKTTSSFQITSVTVGQPKISSDNGDESADDLDESHTDDNSRVTDLETEPSISEDTFSKEEVFFANNALSTTAPAIPTSSQYGLVVVDPIAPTLGQALQNVQVNVADNIINVVSSTLAPGDVKKKDDSKEAQQRSERFKVVKIESTEPFRRGRWMCMDYLDHSTMGPGGKEGGGGNSNEKTASTESGNCGNGEPTKTSQSMIIGSGAAALLENNIDATGNNSQASNVSTAIDGNWNFSESSAGILQHQHFVPSGIATAPATVVHGMQQFTENTTTNSNNSNEGGSHKRQEPQSQAQQQPIYQEFGNASAIPDVAHGQTLPMDYATATAQQLQKSLEEIKKREEAIAAEEAGAMYVPPGNQHQQSQQSSQHGATIPNNLHFHNGSVLISGHSTSNSTDTTQTAQAPHQQQLEKRQQQEEPLIAITEQKGQKGNTPSVLETQQSGTFNQENNFQILQQPQSESNLQIKSNDGHQQSHQQQIQQHHQCTSQTDGAITETGPGKNDQQQTHQPLAALFNQENASKQAMPIIMNQSSASASFPPVQSPPQMQQSTPASIADSDAMTPDIQQQSQSQPQQSIKRDNALNEQHQQAIETANMLGNISIGVNKCGNIGVTVNTNASALNNADDCQQLATNQQQSLQQNSETDIESASGTSAVAIDNKIEQAMDLVKSHLMIAVREEVEVLKEKISELMDKINQLEVENTILKANMPQETLQQLQMQSQLQITSSNAATPASSGANSMMSGAPTSASAQLQHQSVTPPTSSDNEMSSNTVPVCVNTTMTTTTTVNSNNVTSNSNGPLPSS